MATATKKKRPAPVVEEVEDDEVELEELEDDEELEEAPKAAKKSKAKAAADAEVTFGAAALAAHLSKIMGEEISTRALRNQLRAMARRGDLDREIIAGNRSRYDWPLGLKDPEVKTIIAAVKAGEIEESKVAALEKLKQTSAKKKAAAAKLAASQAQVKKKKAKVVEPEEFEDDDED